MPNEELNFKINALTAAFKQGMAEVKNELKQVGKAYQEEEIRRKASEKAVAEGAKAEAAAVKKAKAEEAKATQQAAQIQKESQERANAELMLTTTVAAAAATALYGLFSAVKSGIGVYNQYTAALRGLQGVAEKTNTSMTSLIAANQAVTKDGLITPAQVSQSMKNLLMYGYSVKEATDLLYRLKDAAAYNRQANYSLGEAVVATTEGIRMENSILSDAAGVTKNIAKMYEEYARSIGKASTELTQAEKAQGVYLGMMTETEVVVGNAAKLSQEFAGKQAELDAQTLKLQASFGGAVSGGLSPFVEFLTVGAQAMTGWIDSNRAVVAILTTVTATVLGLVALLGVKAALIKLVGMVSLTAAGEITTLSGAFVALKVAMGGIPGLIIVGVLAAIMGTIAGVGAAAADAKKKAEELRQEIESLSENNSGAGSLVAEFEELSKKTVQTAADTQRMLDIRASLVETYGYSAVAVDAEGRLLAGNLEIMKEQLEVQRALYLEKLKEGSAQNEEDYQKALDKRAAYLTEIAELEKKLADPDSTASAQLGASWTAEGQDQLVAAWQTSLSDIKEEFLQFEASNPAKTSMQNMLKEMVATLREDGKSVPEALQSSVMDAMNEAWEVGGDANAAGQSLLDRFFKIDDSVVQSSIASIQDLRSQLITAFATGGGDEGSSATMVNDLLAVVLGDEAQQAAFARGEELRQKILSGVSTAAEDSEFDALQRSLKNSVLTAMTSLNNEVMSGVPGAQKASKALETLSGSYKKTAAELRAAAAAAATSGKNLNDFFKDYSSSLKTASSDYEGAQKAFSDVSSLKGAVQAIENYSSGLDDSAQAASDARKAREYLADQYGVEASAIDDMLPSISDDIGMKEALAIANYAVAYSSAVMALAQMQSMVDAKIVTEEQAGPMITALDNIIKKMEELGGTRRARKNVGHLRYRDTKRLASWNARSMTSKCTMARLHSNSRLLILRSS